MCHGSDCSSTFPLRFSEAWQRPELQALFFQDLQQTSELHWPLASVLHKASDAKSLLSWTDSCIGVFLEMFLTIELVYTVLMLAAEKSKDTYLAPIGIGLSLFVAEIAGMSSRRMAHVAA